MTTVTVPTGKGDGEPAGTVSVTVSTTGETPAHNVGPAPEGAVTLREASDATGASVSAMRKAIRAGRLPSTVVEGPNGPEHRVTLSAVREAMPKATGDRTVVVKAGGQGTDVVDRDGVVRLGDLSGFLTHVYDQAQERAERAERERDELQAALAHVQAELDRVRGELRALPAGQPVETVPEPAATLAAPDPPPGMVMVRRRWWHRRDRAHE